jgi:thiol-disulfide isomerase/thioredoxin
MALSAFALIFNLDVRLQKWLPSPTGFLQDQTENTAFVLKRLGNHPTNRGRPTASPGLPDFGPAPEFRGISDWLNTPGGKPLSLQSLRGKVVLVDFWTYSCINCLRTLPYLEAWYRTYAKDGLVIVGVHTPEFAFEHELGNVRREAGSLGVRYPVALDNDYATWTSYGNRYWPAEYLIDRTGHIRHSHFGEGEYTQTEQLIRTLLAEPRKALPQPLKLPDRTPRGLITPETYLGYQRIDRYAGSPLKTDRMAHYDLPFVLNEGELAYGGYWKVEGEKIIAGRDARLDLRFQAQKVHLVLGGRGSVGVYLDGKPAGGVSVTQDRLYTLLSLPRIEQGRLELRFTPGVEAYAFTFG